MVDWQPVRAHSILIRTGECDGIPSLPAGLWMVTLASIAGPFSKNNGARASLELRHR